MIYSIDFGVPGGVQSYSMGLVDLLNENNPNAARAIALVTTSDTRQNESGKTKIEGQRSSERAKTLQE